MQLPKCNLELIFGHHCLITDAMFSSNLFALTIFSNGSLAIIRTTFSQVAPPDSKNSLRQISHLMLTPCQVLKHTACSIAPSLIKLFNLSVSAGCLPEDWKLQELSRYQKLMRCHPQQTIDQFQSSLSLARYWSDTSLAK